MNTGACQEILCGIRAPRPGAVPTMIPIFPEFKPLELADRDPVEAYLQRRPALASEYTFTNLFAWRQAYDYHIARYHDGFLLAKSAHGMTTCVQPLVPEDPVDAVWTCLHYLREHGQTPVVDRVGEDVIAHADWEAAHIRIEADRDHADYVYATADLLALEGRKYHAKKNLLHQFTSQYAYEYQPLTAPWVPSCLAFAHDWCIDRRCHESEGLTQENCAVRQILQNYAELHLQGGVLLINGQLVAFTLAEKLNPETLVIHIEKAHAGLTGAYQAIQWEFLRHAAVGVPFVNREQDLGIPGLRKAKESLHPVHMIQKFRLTPQ